MVESLCLIVIIVIVTSTQLKGEAEAYAVEQKAKAEAEQMAKKADAWKDYQDAAMVDMVLETLPKVGLYAEYSDKYLSIKWAKCTVKADAWKDTRCRHG